MSHGRDATLAMMEVFCMRSVLVALFAAALVAAGFPAAEPARAQSVTTPVPAAASAIPPIVWNLIEFPGVGPVNEPGRYTVQFLQDGQISARADCNWVAGLWSAADGVLDVTITQTTLVGCPPDSIEEPFVLALHDATTYSVDGFSLVIAGPTGEMRFAPAMPAMA
jgi:heat shock protein HslJ